MTEALRLPPEVLSLVHHVELNKAGWNQIALQRLLLAAVWLSDVPLTTKQITQFLNNELHISVGKSRANRGIRELIANGSLIRVQGNKVSLTQSELKNVEQELVGVEKITNGARSKFISLSTDLIPVIDADKAWELFNNVFLEDLFHSVGASTYNLLLGKTVVSPPRLEKLLSEYSDEYHQPLTDVIELFLDPKDPTIRDFMLRSLNAYFLVESTGLSGETIEALSKIDKPSFKIFFDTNLIFCILQLHDNPSNEAALSLLRLISTVADYIEVNAFVLPITFTEARKTISAAEDSFGKFPIAPNVAQAAIDSGKTSGLTRTFLEKVKNASDSVPPDEHFGYYANNLKTLLSLKNVKVSDNDLSEIRSDPSVHYDIEEQRNFEVKKFGDRAKGYRPLEHDVMFWHFVHNSRPHKVESPCEAVYWGITVDYRLFAFDAYKRSKLSEDIPVCVHPATLIHLLNFWIPRSKEFEEALISSIQLPFLFQNFDPKSENITLRIIRTISRFEDAIDLSTNTVQSILLNDALRQRISEGDESLDLIEPIRGLMVEKLQEKESIISKSESQMATLESELSERDKMVVAITQELKEVQTSYHDSKTLIENLENKLSKLQIEQSKKEMEKCRRKQSIEFAIKWVLGLGLLLAGINLIVYLLLSTYTGFDNIRIFLFLTIPSASVWIQLINKFGNSNQFIRELPVFQAFVSFRKWLFGTLLLTFLVNALWDLVKSVFNIP